MTERETEIDAPGDDDMIEFHAVMGDAERDREAAPTIYESVQAESIEPAYSPEGKSIVTLLKREQCLRLAMRELIGLLDRQQKGTAVRILLDAGLMDWMGYR
ncbi:hypothetical protein KDW36_15510 [Burkholderia dolosa]|uniref:hypothetical protein n=1 Tax=Burkholderia dolosa TaxID=152500 RepID=UPI001B9E98F5|nr:hypothetical protein [Burkholderia dolosa]MBR8314591.1 hypothetical protein [Burkholderia dolosa]